MYHFLLKNIKCYVLDWQMCVGDTLTVIYEHIYTAIQKFGNAPGKEGFWTTSS